MNEQSDLIDVCAASDVRPDMPVKAQVGGVEVAVFQVNSDYYVTQDLCTHGPGSLAEGYVEGDEIECPFHQGKFSIISGQPTAAPCNIPLRIWQVVLKDDRVCVVRQ